MVYPLPSANLWYWSSWHHSPPGTHSGWCWAALYEQGTQFHLTQLIWSSISQQWRAWDEDMAQLPPAPPDPQQWSQQGQVSTSCSSGCKGKDEETILAWNPNASASSPGRILFAARMRCWLDAPKGTSTPRVSCYENENLVLFISCRCLKVTCLCKNTHIAFLSGYWTC